MNQPNIVFILSDDQGSWAMGCAGNPEIRTPNLDRLAATGTRFDNFFCTSPVCSPARASLLTGRIPSQHGVHDWIKEGNMGEGAIPYLDGQTAYTELLAANGYVCGISGKWHLGDSLTPQKGFTHWFVHQSGGSPYYDAPMIRDGKPVKEKGYVTEVITEDALAFIDRQTGQAPFYLSVHYTAPHSPWIGQHPEDIVALYEDCPFDSCPQGPSHPWAIPNAPWGNKWRENLKGYFAAVTAMDLQIGRLIDRLEAKGLREQTLLVFMGDNGFNCGHHGFWGKGNGTFPQNMYDTSVKVPAIFSHPGTIPQGKVCSSMLSGYDVMPTLLDYTGIPDTMPGGLPGGSFTPLLLGEPMVEREHVFIYDEYGPVRMVRSREWKYVHRYPYGPHELYDLLQDPGERTNLIDVPEQQDRIARMKAELDRWFVRYADPERDGVREPVRGGGQLRLAGPDGGGKTAFT
ncbi:sulfatase-like hydrolase/transferase [Paenibacillus allorhizosphaerae]|uniref:Bifunctional sulfatase/alpha-L-rhamnosidase n=1 Tax=Paenibacillus allorhizosphaerae TaxID=2849866 RepID=A0ABN7TEG9_9BACL|nr:sulfatase-like hydrolase/transferase [Paenibacillus allorhizosphaerae]CAG7626743.1 Bifunctional sulfatase/alpha-L-rhamnosidase [Paenibacillus allorhizosphaerae]